MRRFLIVVTTAVLALLAGSVASAETAAKAGPTHHDGEVSAQAMAGPYTWINQASGKCLDQAWHNGMEHPEVVAFPCNRQSNQDWYLDGPPGGPFRLINARSGKCLDQDWHDGAPHYAVLAWECNGGDNQLWYLSYDSETNTYILINARSNWVLDQDWHGGVEHPEVLAVPYNGGSNQYWF